MKGLGSLCHHVLTDEVTIGREVIRAPSRDLLSVNHSSVEYNKEQICDYREMNMVLMDNTERDNIRSFTSTALHTFAEGPTIPNEPRAIASLLMTNNPLVTGFWRPASTSLPVAKPQITGGAMT